ncbi:MAG: hypothetical protein IPH09_14390 [bacterium]|nr:hypothetical protein [bacterium]
MGEWYEKGGTIASISEHKKIPADWHDPVPILFLVADKPTFQFAIAPRTDAARAELPQVMEALGMALECFGAGAKTAVGYGSMVVEPQAVRSDPLTGFKLWFEAQGFRRLNKGRHSEIIDYMKDLSDVQAGKAYVKSCMNKKACSPRLWAYLNGEEINLRILHYIDQHWIA